MPASSIVGSSNLDRAETGALGQVQQIHPLGGTVKAPSQLIDAPAPGRDDAQSSSGFARRELMKIGAAAVASVPMLAGSPLFAQQAAQQPTAAGANPVQPQSNNPAVAVSEHEGWDEPSRRLVDYVA